MARQRKTVRVEELKIRINRLLRLNNQKCSQDAKLHLCTLLEDILHESGSYNGFRYASGDEYSWQNRTDENRFDRHYL